MSHKTSTHLPIFDGPTTDDEASCSPKVYVSNEEKMLLDSMRELRNLAVELRRRLKEADSEDQRSRIEKDLAELRVQRSDLAIRREHAYKRKMIMLGHLPPDEEVRLF